MAKVIELQLGNGRNDFLGIVPLLKYTQGQNEHRVTGVDAGQCVVTTFVDVHHIVAEAPFCTIRTAVDWLYRHGLDSFEQCVLGTAGDHAHESSPTRYRNAPVIPAAFARARASS